MGAGTVIPEEIRESIEVKRKAILEILGSSPYPLRAEDISRQLRRKNIREPLYKTIEALRALQADEWVELRKGKWESLLPPSDIESLHIQSGGLASAASGELTSSSSGASPRLDQKEDSDWDLFRKLCGYYIDCVENDSGASIKIYDDELERRAVFVNGRDVSWPKSHTTWRSFLPLTTRISGFVRAINGRGKEERCLFGFPIYVEHAKDSDSGIANRYLPIFTVQVSPKIEAGGIAFTTENVKFEINQAWLRDCLRDSEDRKAFLSLCGLFSHDPDDDMESFDSLPEGPIDFLSLVKVLESFFPGQLREGLNPYLVRHDSKTPRRSGIYNQGGFFLGKKSPYTKSLLRDLDLIRGRPTADLDETALRYLFKSSRGENKTLASSPPPSTIIDLHDLNEEQFFAAASALSAPVTVITGPPGTGKSQVVSAAVVSARFADQSILFSSRNHKAIDAVVDRLNSEAPEGEALIIRANPKESAEKKFTFIDAISIVQAQEYSPQAVEKWKASKEILGDYLKRRGETWSHLQRLLSLEDQLAEIQRGKNQIIEQCPALPIQELEANSNKFPRRLCQSLVWTRRAKQRVIGKRRIGSKALFKLMASADKALSHLCRIFLSHFPQFMAVAGGAEEAGFENRLQLANELCALIKRASPIENEIMRFVAGMDRSDLLQQFKDCSALIREDGRRAILVEIQRRKGLPPGEDRESWDSLKSAIRLSKTPMASAASRLEVEKEVQAKSSRVMEHFPAWAVTSLSVGSLLPSVPGLFDTAIIDEAGQCTIAEAIPILFRAKRVGIVGDPNQLGSITRLGVAQDALFRAKNGLNDVLREHRFGYGEKSIYDLCAGVNNAQPVLLRKCYRSFFDIGEYCNQAFYGGVLEILTDEEALKVPAGKKPGIDWCDVRGQIYPGERTGARCKEEQEEVLAILQQTLMVNDFVGTVGVVTPFREQALDLEDLLSDRLPLEVRERSKLLVSTVDSFQGGERDLMVFSLCLGPDMPVGARAFLEKDARRFNVAVSRARAVLVVVGNQEFAAGSGIPHIESLAKRDWEVRFKRSALASPWAPHESPWEKILYEALKSEGVSAEPQHRVLGRRLDLALRDFSRRKKIDIEVDGASFHMNSDGTRKRDDIFRDVQLKAAGWKVMRFWVYELRSDLEKCVAKIKKEWED